MQDQLMHRGRMIERLAVTPEAHRAAFVARRMTDQEPQLFTDTPTRLAMRSLLDAAALAGAEVHLAFIKANLEMRYMVCRPYVGRDESARYYTVEDLELSRKAGEPVERRVCLDSLAAVLVLWNPAQNRETPSQTARIPV